jgi:riboflavin synthase
MFTGIIEDLARVKTVSKTKQGAVLSVESKICAHETKIGDSISIDGVCLTAIDVNKAILRFQISSETLERSGLGRLKSGDKVNMERALRQDSRLSGHFVTGHIDDMGSIIAKKRIGEFVEIEIGLPEYLMVYLAEKGSVAIDGISLTVNKLKDKGFSVFLIPHTLSVTTLGCKNIGDPVNIETDILAKYIQRQINNPSPKPASNISRNLLKEHGFI